MRAHQLQQLGKHFRVSGDDIAGGQIIGLSGKIADQAARFGDQQCAGGHVPGRKAELPESVQASGRDIGQVECGRTGAAQTGGLLRQFLEYRQVGVDMRERAIGEAGADQRVGQLGAIRDADSILIDEGAAALAGGE